MKKHLAFVCGLVLVIGLYGTANALPVTSFRITEEGSLVTHGIEWNTFEYFSPAWNDRSPIGVTTESNPTALLNNPGKTVGLTLNPGDTLLLHTESFYNSGGSEYWLFNNDTYFLFIGEAGTEREIGKFAFNNSNFSTISGDPSFKLEFLGFSGDLVTSAKQNPQFLSPGQRDPGLHAGGQIDAVYKLTYTPVPEPATMFLLGSGLIGVGAFVRRKFRK